MFEIIQLLIMFHHTLKKDDIRIGTPRVTYLLYSE